MKNPGREKGTSIRRHQMHSYIRRNKLKCAKDGNDSAVSLVVVAALSHENILTNQIYSQLCFIERRRHLTKKHFLEIYHKTSFLFSC